MENQQKNYDIFISYHGGNGDSASSSYPKALELKKFFENHTGKSYTCFLCKEEKCDDFYDAINQAIISAKHFILVACDKTKLSEWVNDELKQFDGLRKTGKKPNSVINAYIYGEITIDDLVEFNSLFSTKDVVFGEDGFEQLYRMVLAKEDSMQNKLTFNYSDIDIKEIAYLRPISRRFFNCISNYLRQADASEAVVSKINEDISAFESFAVRAILLKQRDLDGDFVIVRVNNPVCLADYLSEQGKAPFVKLLIVNYESTEAILYVNDTAIPVPNMNDLAVIFKNTTIRINAIENEEINLMEIITGENKTEMPHSSYTMYGPVPVFTCKLNENNWSEDFSDYHNTAFCFYILNTLYNKIMPLECKAKSDLFDDMDLCSMELDSPFDKTDCELRLLNAKSEILLSRETDLLKYYQSIKYGEAPDKEVTKSLFASKYSTLAYKLKEYYSKHSSILLTEFLNELLETALAEKESGSYSKYEFLTYVVAEIYLHNIFVLDHTFMENNNIYDRITCMYNDEYIGIVKNKLEVLLCAYRKEMYFSGDFHALGGDADTAQTSVLNDFGQLIEKLQNCKENGADYYRQDLVLLYRQRSVIYEHCGDSSLKADERKSYYRLWKQDCELALKEAEGIACDKEIIGCVYLNLASAINRLSSGEKDRMNSLKSCLVCLDTALEMFKNNSADRYIAYGYLHKSDCYEAMLQERKIDSIENFDSETQNIIREIRANSTRALNLFKNTSDYIAKCWSMRLSVKGRILSSTKETLLQNIINAFRMFREALQYCQTSQYVNGMAACVRDFTLYIEIIRKENLYAELRDEILNTFFEEISVFASIVKLLKLEKDDCLSLQKQMENLVTKLID